MTEFIERYETQLVEAARVRARRPAWRRDLQGGRRVAVVGLAVIAVGGTAAAATAPWVPVLGDANHTGATRADDAPPPEQLDGLSVLRRPQTAADRATQMRYALRFLGDQDQGVRTGYARLLHVESDGRGIVLLPVARGEAMGRPASDTLCVVSADQNHGDPVGTGGGCFTWDQVRDGEGWNALGLRAFGLVPDGVANLRLHFVDGRRLDVPVEDNTYVYTAPGRTLEDGTATRVPSVPTVTEWLDADGQVVKTIRHRQSLHLARPQNFRGGIGGASHRIPDHQLPDPVDG